MTVLSWPTVRFVAATGAISSGVRSSRSRTALARLTDRRDVRLWIISGVVAAITAGTGTEVAFLFLGAGILILFWDAPPWRSATGLLGLPSLLGLLPTAVGSGTLLALFLFFLKAGAFIFGSGLAVVRFLREGWSSSSTG